MDQSGPNGSNRTEVDQSGQNGLNDQSGHNMTNVD